MRWNIALSKPDIPGGQTRIRRKFAWWPRFINGSLIWLEHYEILQAYIITEYTVNLDDKPTIFYKGSWLNISIRDRN